MKPSEVTTLGGQLKGFNRIVSLIINVIKNQSTRIAFTKFTYCTFMAKYRQTGFEQGIVTAIEIALELNVQAPQTRVRLV